MSETKTRIVVLEEARQHTLSAGPAHMMRLNPGRNIVDETVYQRVSSTSETFKALVSAGKIVVKGESIDLKKMNAAEAIETIEAETTVEGVDELMETEMKDGRPRKTVVEAAESWKAVLEETGGGDPADDD